MTIAAPQCLWCAHYSTGGYQQCRVFPTAIPDDIWYGEHDHRKPFEGDTGITFKEDPGAAVPIDWPLVLVSE